MLDIFGGLRMILKRQEIVVDNVVFRLHYMVTAVLLVACSVINTAKQYIGNPIECIQNDQIPFINVYCWIHSTFIMPGSFHQKMGTEVAFPGVANSKGEVSEQKYYAYYQWVCFVLFFQAALFYIPKLLWNAWEGNLMSTVVMGMHFAIGPDEEKSDKRKILVDYLLKHVRSHNFYAIRYFTCEFLALVNVIFQMYIMNKFLGGEFWDYGSRVMEFSEMEQYERADPMVYVFPRMTKCIFHKVGPSGDIQRHDALCILPLNIVNEKIYILLWFWFIFLTAVTCLLLIYRLALFVSGKLRSQVLHARCRLAPQEYLNSVLQKTKFGDWFVLYMLGKNIDPLIFKEVIAELAKRIETADSNETT